MMSQKQLEQRALKVSIVVNLISAAAGMAVFVVTGLQALFLDGFFSFIAFLSSVAAIVISRISRRRTGHYPDGLYFLEPLYAIFKSLLTLSLLALSFMNTFRVAVMYFAGGEGKPIETGPVLPYTVCMVLLCFGLAAFNRYQNSRINNVSTILTAEFKTNFVDGVQSFGIGLAVVLLNMIDINGQLGFFHYTGDFFITAAIVAVTVKEPVNVIAVSFREMTGGTAKDKKLLEFINGTVSRHIGDLGSGHECNVYKIGMHIRVYLRFEAELGEKEYTALYEAKSRILDDISEVYESAELIYCI